MEGNATYRKRYHCGVDHCARKATRRTLIAGLMPLALLRGSDGNHRHLGPADESDKDVAFRDFRRSLLAAIRNRDVRHLLTFVAPDIMNSDGSDAGQDGFRRTWRLERPATSVVWELLAETVQLGCMRDRNGVSGFVAPYVYALFPKEFDPASYFVVVRPKAKLYERPAPMSPVIETLHWDIVEYLEGDLRLVDWHNVKTASGREGFVRETDVRSSLDYRTIFQKQNGRWVITAFVDGT
jgi:hypothetical protein